MPFHQPYIMKTSILFVLLLINGLFAYAQKPDSTTNKTDKTTVVARSVMSPSNDIIQNISSSPEFTIFTNAIKTAALTDNFKSNGLITVFAPTNKAFGQLVAGKLDTLLLPAHKAELTGLILNHALTGIISSKDIEKQIKAGNGKATFTTLSGGILTARINENRNIVLTDETGGESVISRFDIRQSNGMLHITTGVLIPQTK
ncbi:MAG: fasciclin protein [Mucilaginibacter sp.]|nr:fasciclin protein [Mucilaginibacter sp.]